jgi:hypothetical protein
VVVLQAPLALNNALPTRTVSRAPPPEGLENAVEQVRRGSDRFRPVSWRLVGNVVILQQGGGQAEDVMAFARAISRLPGLTRIVILSGDEAVPNF